MTSASDRCWSRSMCEGRDPPKRSCNRSADRHAVEVAAVQGLHEPERYPFGVVHHRRRLLRGVVQNQRQPSTLCRANRHQRHGNTTTHNDRVARPPRRLPGRRAFRCIFHRSGHRTLRVRNACEGAPSFPGWRRPACRLRCKRCARPREAVQFQRRVRRSPDAIPFGDGEKPDDVKRLHHRSPHALRHLRRSARGEPIEMPEHRHRRELPELLTAVRQAGAAWVLRSPTGGHGRSLA